jgi:hypothetical protein
MGKQKEPRYSTLYIQNHEVELILNKLCIYIYTYIIHPEKIIHPVHPKTFNQRTLGAQVSCGQVSIQLAPLAQAVTHFWWFNLKILGRKAMGSMGYFAPQKMGWYPSPSGSHAS